MGNRILVIDDEQPILQIMEEILKDEKYRVFTAADGVEGLELLKTEPVDLVFLDVWMPRMGGLEVLEHIKKDFPETAVIIISGHANVDMAVKAIKLGAFDFIEKPLDIDRLLTLARNALQLATLKKENRKLKKALDRDDEMIGESAAMNRIRELVDQSAPTDSRVLILGENGTGKELVARRIHSRSRRSEGPFIEVNCAAIPDTLIESELFGHEKGSFTGAVSQRIGRFEAADGGTLFLDEIADMSLQAQAKVLRAVQEMKFIRVGGRDPVEVDVRIIAATNKDLQKEIHDGRFREDLYFRLNVIPITIPPLRERKEDLPALMEHLLKHFCDKHRTFRRRLTPGAMDALKERNWPGNIRELKNFAERLVVMTTDEELGPEAIKENIQPGGIPESAVLSGSAWGQMKLQDARDTFERELLIAKLEENEYNISKTSEALGIYPSNLHSKIKKFGIEIKR
jgi:two-component system nitrogen regulation response regulator NtrX